MDATTLRARGDLELAQQLLADKFVQEIIQRLEHDESETPQRVRRQLLATSLRLTRAMMPDVHATIDACRERLGIGIPLEVYVYPSADFNAACVKPEDGRLFILVSSSLLEAFPEGERRFVIGHELGHHLYGHHDIPVGHILRGDYSPGPALALRLFAWSRYAEISSDRAGAFCVEDPDDVARGLFRLASGLRRPLRNVGIAEFANQFDDLKREPEESTQRGARSDWFSTHPFSPLRLKAAELFFQSKLSAPDGFVVDTLEARVHELMALMEPNYLEEKSEQAETARRLLFAGAIAVADADGGISDAEIAAFEEFFGKGSFGPKLDIPGILAALDQRIADATRLVSFQRRIQVLRDLSVIACADGEVSPAERKVIEQITRGLEVPLGIIDLKVCGDCSVG